ncbi:MFS transporter [Sulfodiicoccus acidiphilus]|uniref:MFS transporter n=1 Tax=Sulfodiicoccus acidiphilus TaxID=1670455 RepID=A0A348B2H7_9CREN|nr:MFS transporter [Sulfodiicoccus acidiphilus]BBD72379.1 MFS transporter [Sulfodiicoccus acidiphilus]GGT97522.1 MFS transporter [Sulfodiicoccus acidiphilus]
MVSPVNRLSVLGGMRAFGGSVVWPFVGVALNTVYHLSLIDVAIFYAAQGGVTSVAYLIGGLLADYLGRKKAMQVSAMLSALALLAGFIVEEGKWVTFFLLFQTFFNSVYQVANTAAVGDTTSEIGNLIRAFSRVRVGINIGWAAGPALGGLLFHYNFSLCLLASAAITLASVPLVPRVEVGGIRVLSLRVNRSYVRFLLPNFLAATVMGQLGFPLIEYLSTVRVSTTFAGLLFTLNGVLIVAFQEPVGRFLAKFNPVLGLSLAMIGYGISYFSFSLVRNFLDGMVCVVGVTTAEMIASPLINALANYLADKSNRGKYMGAFGLTTSLGRTIGTSISAGLMGWFPYDGLVLWGAVAIFAFSSAFLFWRLPLDFENSQGEPKD